MDRTASTAHLNAYTSDAAAVKDGLRKLLAAAETKQGRDSITELTAWFDAYTVAAEHSFALKRSGKYEAAATEFLRLDMSKGQQLISVFVNLRSARMSSAATKVAETSRAAIVASIAGALTAILPGLQSRSPWAVRFPNVCALSPHQSRMPYALISAR